MVCGLPTANLTLANQRYKTGSKPSKLTYTAATVIICFVGYKFTDFSNENVMNCSAFGTWTAIPECIRMFCY